MLRFILWSVKQRSTPLAPSFGRVHKSRSVLSSKRCLNWHALWLKSEKVRTFITTGYEPNRTRSPPMIVHGCWLRWHNNAGGDTASRPREETADQRLDRLIREERRSQRAASVPAGGGWKDYLVENVTRCEEIQRLWSSRWGFGTWRTNWILDGIATGPGDLPGNGRGAREPIFL